jgi:hypothetical protein
VAAFEAGALFAAMVVFIWLRERGYHPRWLSYRLLAERLRAAFFVAPTGQDFRRVAALEAVFVERASDWLQRSTGSAPCGSSRSTTSDAAPTHHVVLPRAQSCRENEGSHQPR